VFVWRLNRHYAPCLCFFAWDNGAYHFCRKYDSTNIICGIDNVRYLVNKSGTNTANKIYQQTFSVALPAWNAYVSYRKDWYVVYVNTTNSYINNLNIIQLLGILQSSGTVGQSKTVALPWQVSSGHSWLITWMRYFLKSDWTIWLSPISWSLVPDIVKEYGLAVSATQLLIK